MTNVNKTKPLRNGLKPAKLSAMTQKSSDKLIVEGFLKGDPKAVRTINEYLDRGMSRHQDRLGYEADDVKSVAFMKLNKYLEEGAFRYDCSLSSYTYRIVNSVAIDFYRKRLVRNAEDIDTVERSSDEPNPEEILLRKENVQLGFKVILLMSKECRKLWQMTLIDGLSGRDVARKLGWTEGNVRQKLFACRKKANQVLNKMTKDD